MSGNNVKTNPEQTQKNPGQHSKKQKVQENTKLGKSDILFSFV